MKRDMDLIREILIEMEQWPADESKEISIGGRTDAEVTYHLGLMAKHGLIEAIDVSSYEGAAWLPRSLTWEGHEFLDAARSESIWRKAKERVLSATGTLTVEALKEALKVIIRQAVIDA